MESRPKQRGRPSKKKATDGPRIFTMPKPNYDAVNYYEMINWREAQNSEPPLLKDYDDEQIQQFRENALQLDIPGNTQFVERQIKVVTQKGTVAADPKVQDGSAKATLQSQKKMPRCKTRADFLAICSP